MVPTKKIIFSMVMMVSLCFSMSCKVYGAFEQDKEDQEFQSGYEVFIDDTQNLLSDGEILTLRSEMEKLTEYGNMVCITFYGNYCWDNEVAKSIYHDLYEEESGIIVYVDTWFDQISVYYEGDCQKLLTTEQEKTIMRDKEDQLKMHEYADAMTDVFEGIRKGVETRETSDKWKVVYYVFMAIMIGVVCCFLILRYMTEHHKPSTEDLMWAANSHIRIHQMDIRRER